MNDISIENLVVRLGELLKDKSLTITTAESCTAGGIGAAIASVNGASSYFTGGVVVYTNGMKEKILGVDLSIIGKYGVVSAETAAAMNEGVRKITGADVAVSITGYVGACGGDGFADNGTVCICVACNGKEAVHKHLTLTGERLSNQREAVRESLVTVVEYLENDCRAVAGRDSFSVQGHIVDVVAQRVYDGEVFVCEGKVKSILEKPVDASAPYLMPGFVDAHVHIESSMMIPENFAREALRHGTVAAVCDPHEIANVLGIEGVQFMIDNSKKVPFHFHFGAPSCVPCTDKETSGASLGPAEVAQMLDNPDIHFLAEMMFYMGVVQDIPFVTEKIKAARDRNKPIDGHAPGLGGDDLQKYIDAGISTDHECSNYEEAVEKIRGGMMILVREGSAAKNFDTLCPLLNDYPDSLMFCTDDKHPDDLVNGYIDVLVRKGVERRYPFWNVLRAATLNPVRHYGLDCGLLQEGDGADFILVDNLLDFKILGTYIYGKKYEYVPTPYDGEIPNNFKACPITVDDIRVKAGATAKLRVIEAYDGSLFTGSRVADARIEDGYAVSDPDNDVLKIVAYNRYEKSEPSVAFISGMGLKKGAIGTTVAHDSHNMVVIGVSDDDIVKAVNELIRMQGGMVAVSGDTTRALALPVAGLMSVKGAREMSEEYGAMQQTVRDFGCRMTAPYMTMSFMCLPVIPNLKMTDKGLFDVGAFDFTMPCL